MTQTNPDRIPEEPRPVDNAANPIPPAETVVVEPDPLTVEEAEESPKVRQESRFGRFMRNALRTLLLLAVVFGLGALTIYYFLYRPVADQLDSARRESTQSAEQLRQAEQNLEKAQGDLELATSREQESAGRLEVELARVAVLRAMNELTNARMALAADNPEGAVEALTASEEHLQQIAPTLEARDSAQLETLQALYQLAKNDIARDPELAKLDLDRLQTELEIAEKNVLK